MEIEFVDESYSGKNGEWIPVYTLNYLADSTLLSWMQFDTREGVSFMTKAEANQWGRRRALRWRDANYPGAELFERRAERN
ncbi:hypothetical protein [Candidatus Binatus sp.]|uniref:hypothetical protein n=1 Tax=Candidatus Binatus sp. TaxID=2811406 RepID=UPI003C3766BD